VFELKCLSQVDETNKYIELMLLEHKWIESLAIKFLKYVLSKYVENEINYRRYVTPLMENVEKLVKPHHIFDEEKVFPKCSNVDLVKKQLLEEQIALENKIKFIVTMKENMNASRRVN